MTNSTRLYSQLFGFLRQYSRARDLRQRYRSSVTLSRGKPEIRIFSGLWNSTREEIHQSN